MEWDNASSLKLIELYRERECLWNPTDVDYKNKIKRLDSWKEISDTLLLDVTDVRKKMESLLTSFRRERQREINRSGAASNRPYKSTWFAYRNMLFLQDKLSHKKTGKVEEISDLTIEYLPSDIEENNLTARSINGQEPNDANTEEVHEFVCLTPNSAKQTKSQILIPVAANQRKRPRPPDHSYSLSKELNDKRHSRDESAVYAEHIASKHRKYSLHTRSVVEYLISKILFKADMGYYEKDFNTSHSQNNACSPYRQNIISDYHMSTSSPSHPYSSQSPSPSNTSQNCDVKLHQSTSIPAAELVKLDPPN